MRAKLILFAALAATAIARPPVEVVDNLPHYLRAQRLSFAWLRSVDGKEFEGIEKGDAFIWVENRVPAIGDVVVFDYLGVRTAREIDAVYAGASVKTTKGTVVNWGDVQGVVVKIVRAK